MHLSAVTIFETGRLTNGNGGLDFERIRAHVAARLPERDGYRQRIHFTPVSGRPVWVDDPSFDMRRHVSHVALPPPGNDAQLRELTGQILSQPLDRARPLWEMWVVEGLSGGRYAVIAKLHHALLDGVAGIGLVQALLSSAPESESGPPPRFTPRPRPGFAEQILDEASHALSSFGALGDALLNPSRSTSKAASGLSALWDTVQLGARLPPSTPVNGPHGMQRRVDWATLDLHEIHDVRKRLDGTVNDVVLAVVTGALRRFFRARRVRLKDLAFRVTVPVNLRGEDEERVGNRVGALFIDLPLAERDPLRRFAAIRDRTLEAKRSRCAEGVEAIHRFLDWSRADLLVSIGSRLVNGIRPHNMVVTSIPGPGFPLYLLESRMLELHPQLPLFPNQGLGVAAASYCGKVHFDWVADWELVPDVERLAGALAPAFEELQQAAGRRNGKSRGTPV
jgi:WS/DGAT/MGAT family acyltransferase